MEITELFAYCQEHDLEITVEHFVRVEIVGPNPGDYWIWARPTLSQAVAAALDGLKHYGTERSHAGS